MTGDVAKGLKSFKKGMAEEEEPSAILTPPVAKSLLGPKISWLSSKLSRQLVVKQSYHSRLGEAHPA